MKIQPTFYIVGVSLVSLQHEPLMGQVEKKQIVEGITQSNSYWKSGI